MKDMDLLRIASRIATDAPETILEAVRATGPDSLPAGISSLLGTGHYGEAYNFGDRVLKVAVAKSESAMQDFFRKLEKIQKLKSDIFVQVFDFGYLCDIHMPEHTKYMVKDGPAYFYVMERVRELSKGEGRIAVRTFHDLREMEKKENPAQERKKYMFARGREYKRDGDIEDGGPNPLMKGADLYDRMKAAGVNHRDIHVQNLRQNDEGTYKLIDLESADILEE